MRSLAVCLAIAVLVVGLGSRAAEPAKDPLAPLEFLLGRWEVEGGGTPGASSGALLFEKAAGGRAIVRFNQSSTPEGLHADVMLIYVEGEGPLRALYTDSEGHVIHYTVDPSAVSEIVFSSEPAPTQPRFRLSYRMNADKSLTTKFETAAPGSAEFKTHLEGTGHRR